MTDDLDHFSLPVMASRQHDAKCHLDGQSLGNSERVAECMMFSLFRVLESYGNKHEDLIKFVRRVLD